jgi:PHP family Zn ribbon phosphoesterase
MLKEFKADLHIHTCLSPCADLRMTPSSIIRTAFEKGIDIIAVTDHNSAENVLSTKKAVEDTGITVLAGMEITTSEEVHILAIFEDFKEAIKLQDIVYDNLQQGENDERQFGEQLVVNEKNEVVSFNKRLLIGATGLNTRSVMDLIRSLGGLSIASHIDRDAFGIISQLGFIPGDLSFDALEISPRTDKKTAAESYKDYDSMTWISSSDAHCLEDIGKRITRLFVQAPTITEISKALKRVEGRKAVW